jgi:hypothetical protein
MQATGMSWGQSITTSPGLVLVVRHAAFFFIFDAG